MEHSSKATVLEIEHLQKYYKKNIGVKDISLSVKKGEIFGFLGSNGAGKSTTIRCLLGLIKPSGGQMTLFGGRYGSLTESLHHIGYMPSEAMFYPTMKVKDVIAFAAKVRKKDCSQEAKRLSELLEVPSDKKIEELSLGNRKKVSIVCALQHQPDLIILDEPTSGLDPLMQERFFKLIKEACSKGATCFLSSHVLSEIKNYCDRVAILKNGEIVTVDAIHHLTHSMLRKVSVWKGGKLKTFNYSGSMKDLLKQLEEMNPDDLLIEEPSLESLFLHYYEEKDNDHTIS
ncbi:ABC transporter ATP-binding protein [Streptococcus mutans]|jgi:ABC-type multidrug transport system, ATPase component|uniref:ABC transporter, ATP-binding protein n=2 Tax=Streptococcus mutans TaxID=1309 RepID=Q8DU79_STRMU|nr:ABC transporter ATP-binding protein [Streptococcus mutans]RKW01437.1 MAG: ABC transporter ATP-binding protein [Streptococcus sp.]AAN58766.1 putative ABC transporter, ATP-binding protein [Streptococcus mutans UA159]AJD55402.1 ABC transporter ATP-binding protein [Streptococcus mutans UA159-FR]AMF85418.1 ABC transporter [Streptococcus mutans]ARS62416.1 ABC transporter ATP-binding protein [Streptococcus mutans]